jgi:hypothetical protein
MSGIEIPVIIGGVLSIIGVVGGLIDKWHNRKMRLKNREDIKNIKMHVQPRIIISSNGSLTPKPTPKENDENDDIELSDINLIDGRFIKVPIFYDTQTGEYIKELETPRPQQPY